MSISLEQLEEKLNELPHKIRIQKDAVLLKEKEYEEAKLTYQVEYSMALVAARKPNAAEKKADAIVSSQPTYLKVIEMEYNLEKEKSGLKYLEDKFIACRKIASLEQEMLRSQLGGQ